MFKTYDSFKPQAADAGKLAGWASVDLEEVKAKLSKVVEEAKKNDPAELRRKIAELEREIKKPHDPAVDVDALRKAEEKGFDRGLAYGQNLANNIRVVLLSMADANEKMLAGMESIRSQINGDDPGAKFVYSGGRTENPVRRVEPAPPGGNPRGSQTGTALAGARARQIDARPAAPMEVGSPGGAGRRIMIALAQNPEGITGRKLAILADVAQGGSTWRGALAGLRKAAHVDDNGEFFKLTEEGLQALGAYEPLPTGAALREYWQRKIGSGTRGRIFAAILTGGGRPVPAHQVAAEADVELGGSTWRGHMAYLRGLELVTGSDELRASEDLFS
jgi:hypothetical protein